MVKIIKRFYQFVWRYKLTFAVFLVVMVVGEVMESIGPYIIKLLVDKAGDGQTAVLAKLVAIYAAVKIGGNLVATLSFWLADKVQIPAARDARQKIFRYIQDLDFAFHVDKNTGSLISAFKRGDGAFFNLFMNFHHDVLRTIVGLAVTLFFFGRVNNQIFWMMMGLFATNTMVMLGLIKLNMATRKKFNEAEDEVSAVITDNLLNYETVKFFAQENKEGKRLAKSFVGWTKTIWGFSNSFRLMDISLGTLSGLGMFWIMTVVVKMLAKGQVGVGDFVMISGFITGFYYRFFSLFFQLRNIAKSFIDLEKYFQILDNPIKVKDPAVPKQIEKFRGKIKFDQVSFRYPSNRKQVLSKINLVIPQGESVALVGKSGAGKSTVVKLLLRFYDPTRGKIEVDGVDIKKMTKSYLRSFMGVVPQEPILFNNTIGFNIGYGKKRAKLWEIKKAAQMANLADFIEALPDKYETQVGERGIKLSGGQKQRLAIARALLADSPIIIFDEATSNLDSESEGKIQEALWSAAKNRTLIIIAHRFATIRRAKRIVVFDKGRIVETGDHQKLIKKENGVYKKLWTLQVKGKTEKDEGGLLNGR